MRHCRCVPEELQARVDAIDAPALLLAPGLELIAANAPARRLASASGGYTIAGRAFALHTPIVQATLRAEVARMARVEGQPARLLLPLEGAGPPMIGRLRRDGDHILLVLCPPAPPSDAAVAQVAAHYRLTSTECGLLAALLGGDTLAGYAQARGIGREAARFHAKALFAKTGTHRQTELVRLVLMLAIGLDAQ